MPVKWRIIDSGKLSGAMNMAIDEAIFEAVSKGEVSPTIRFYDWERPTFSCGYNQNYKKEIDLDKVTDKNYHFVRRATGGRLVLHKDEVTYSLIVPIRERFDCSVNQSYLEISKALVNGLKLMNIEATLEKSSLSLETQKQNVNPCFSSASKFELLVDNKKIIGSAQLRKNGVLLQHGSILLNYNQEEIADFLPNISAEQTQKIKNLLRKKTVFINRLNINKLTYDDVVDYMIKGFSNVWSEDSFIAKKYLTNKEENNSYEIFENKFSKNEWNFMK